MIFQRRRPVSRLGTDPAGDRPGPSSFRTCKLGRFRCSKCARGLGQARLTTGMGAARIASVQRRRWCGRTGLQSRLPAVAHNPSTTCPRDLSLQLSAKLLSPTPHGIRGRNAGDRISFRCGEHKTERPLLAPTLLARPGDRGGNCRINGSRSMGMQFVEMTGAVRGAIRIRVACRCSEGWSWCMFDRLPEGELSRCSSQVFNDPHGSSIGPCVPTALMCSSDCRTARSLVLDAPTSWRPPSSIVSVPWLVR